MQNRPKLVIEKDRIDHILLGLGWIGWIFLALLPIFYYSELPAEIPRHYGLDGQADAWDDKGMIWSLPTIGSILFFGLMVLRRFPHLFNYPVEITEANAYRHYKSAARLMTVLNTVIILSFAYITFATIQSGMGSMPGLGSWFLPIFLLLIFGAIALYLYKTLAKGDQKQ